MKYYAQTRKRFVAALFDYGLFYTIFFFYLFSYGEPNEEGVTSVSGKKTIPIFLLWFFYFAIAEGLLGQTLGKKIMKIKVAKVSGNHVNVLQSGVRHLFDFIDFAFFGLVGILLIKNSDKHQRVGDIIAKTIVINVVDARCQKYHSVLVLDGKDLKAGYFNCPECEFKNNLL